MLKSWIYGLRLKTGLAALVVTVAAAAALFPKKHVFGSATVPAYGEVIHHSIAPVQGGRVAELRVRVGQVVRAGDMIARLDDRLLELERETARTVLAQVQAKVDAAMDTQDSEVTRSELWVLRAKASQHGDRAQLAELDKQVARLGGLYANQMIPATLVESSQQQQHALAARVSTYNQVIGGGLASSARRTGTANEQHRAAVEARISPYRQAVLVQTSLVRELDQKITDLSLVSPVDGIISVLSHHPGEVIQSGSEVVSIVSSRPGVIIAIVPEKLVLSVRVGAALTVRRDGLISPPIAGQVIELSPEVEEVPVRARPSPNIPAWGRRVAIELPKDQNVLPGEAFSVSF